MKKTYKIEEQLTSEGTELRQRVAELEKLDTAHKQTKQPLGKAEEDKLTILNSISELVTLQDMGHRIVWANRAAAKSVNLPAGQLVGRHCYEIWNQQSQPCTGCPVTKARRTSKPQKGEMTTPDGRVWSVRGYPVLDEYERVTGILNVTLDVTERKRAEQALKESEAFSSSLMVNSPNPASVINPDTSLRYVNPALEKLTGFPAAELIGKKAPYPYWGQDTLQKTFKGFKKAMRQGGEGTEELFQKKNGERFWVEITSTRVVSDGEFKYLLANWADITERKKAEEALKESQQFSTSLLESLPNPIFVVNPDTSVKYVNPAFEKLTGFTLAETYGQKAPHSWWPQEYQEDMLAGLKKAIAAGGRKSERIFQKKNGERLWIALNSAAEMQDGKLVYLLINWVDITERKLAEDRQQEMQRELLLSSRLASIGELAAGVAHQINNPLTGVLGFSQRLLRKSTDPEINQDLKKIHAEAGRAAKVVQNLLTFARRRQPQKQYSEINEILESALELRAYELNTSNIEVITNLAPKLPQIMLDFYQIQEVFLNIILNAEQAMTEAKSGGKLIIKTEERKTCIRVAFSNDGPAIPTVNLDMIFDPFFTTKAEKGGTGLGLSVCHGIITEHGGKIYAKSKPDKGTTFYVELPTP